MRALWRRWCRPGFLRVCSGLTLPASPLLLQQSVSRLKGCWGRQRCLGTMFFLWVVLLHIPRVAGAIRNGNEVTSLFVAVAMCGLSFVLAGVYGRSLEGRGAF